MLLQSLRIGFWIIALVIAGFQAWSARYQLFGGDSLSYLDMADFIRLGKFQDSLSSYWSPAFPTLIAIFIAITKAKVNAYFALMKVVGLFVFCLLLSRKSFFWLLSVAFTYRATNNPQQIICDRYNPSCCDFAVMRHSCGVFLFWVQCIKIRPINC